MSVVVISVTDILFQIAWLVKVEKLGKMGVSCWIFYRVDARGLLSRFSGPGAIISP
jgi:hypothetical protein